MKPTTRAGRWYAHQCPGCFSVTVFAGDGRDYECDCGEKLTRIDLRDSEAVASLTAQNETKRAALREIENDDPPDSEDRWATVVRLMQIARTALEDR
jgi:hypothetical protein